MPVDPSLRRLLDALPESEREDPRRRAEVERAYSRLVREREARRLKDAEPGKAGAGIGSCLDLSEGDYRTYRRGFRRSWDFTPWKVKRYEYIPASRFTPPADDDSWEDEAPSLTDTLDWLEAEYNRADVVTDQTIEERTAFDTPLGRLSAEEMERWRDGLWERLNPDLLRVLEAYGNTYDPKRIGGQKYSAERAARRLRVSVPTFRQWLRRARAEARRLLATSRAEN